MHDQQGSTLFEVLLVVALFGILVAASQPWSIRSNYTNDLALAVGTTTSVLRRAVLAARASDGDSSWGVKIGTNQLVLFKGASFATRLSSVDDIFSLPASVTVTGDTEIVWAKFTGTPGATTSTIILATPLGDQQTLIVTGAGVVNY